MAERIDRDGSAGVTSLTDLQLTVTDSGGLEDSIYLNITIEDVNDNPPVFSETIYHVNVTENTAPSMFYFIFCSHNYNRPLPYIADAVRVLKLNGGKDIAMYHLPFLSPFHFLITTLLKLDILTSTSVCL